MRIKVVFVIVLFGIFDTTWAQFVWDTVPSDTLQFSPMIYCYNCPDTSVYHDSIECTFYETNGSMTGNDYPTWYGHYLTEFALYQHTDRPLKVVGIAFSAVRGNYAELRLYDSVMNLIASDTMLSWECWDMDPSRYDVFVLPGKTTTDMEFPLTEKIELQLLYFSNINEGITLTGGFWI